MTVGTCVIHHPSGDPSDSILEARCTPLLDGGWRVDSIRGTTDHPKIGDPYLAVDHHIESDSVHATLGESEHVH